MTMLDTSYHKRRLNERMRDPEFRREYEVTQKQIAQVDAIVRELDFYDEGRLTWGKDADGVIVTVDDEDMPCAGIDGDNRGIFARANRA
jgi:hypothetical protein